MGTPSNPVYSVIPEDEEEPVVTEDHLLSTENLVSNEMDSSDDETKKTSKDGEGISITVSFMIQIYNITAVLVLNTKQTQSIRIYHFMNE